MASFIFFGERFSSERTYGEFGSYTCLNTELGVEWEAIQAALDRGEDVHIRQSLPVEMEVMEAFLAEYQATCALATVAPPARTVH